MDHLNIVKRCQTGELEAFEELYNLYVKQAMKTARLLFGHRGIAEDVVQEAFIQCYKGIGELKSPETFQAWFYKILVRAGWRIASKHQRTVVTGDFLDNPNLGNYHEPGVDEWAEIQETGHAVREAVKKLNTPMKTVVILYYYNNLTIKEIAEILDCFQGTVKSRLRKARILLEKELEHDFRTDAPPAIYQKKECRSNG